MRTTDATAKTKNAIDRLREYAEEHRDGRGAKIATTLMAKVVLGKIDEIELGYLLGLKAGELAIELDAKLDALKAKIETWAETLEGDKLHERTWLEMVREVGK